ncbi:MAG: PP2C family protein-serine/threonine phosphatase [Planctomycetota bacterium]
MGIFGFGRGSRNPGGDETPPRVPAPHVPSDDGSVKDDSFLTGDERVDSKNVNMLLETIAAVNSTIELDPLLISIVDKAISVTRSERGFLLLRDGDGKELATRVARDAVGRDLPKDTRFSTKVTSQVEQTRQPVHSMVNSDAKALELSQSVFDLKIRAVMCVPLLAKGNKVLGAIYVDSRVASREFTRADLKFFAAFASQAAVALENARLVLDSLEKERMAGELRVAQKIQKRMMPNLSPKISPFEISGYYTPASEATGDSYDFVELGNGKLAFAVADVSGHGIGPALVTVASRARLRAYLGMGVSLGDAVTRLNRDIIHDVETGIFQTLFLGVLDPREGTLQYVNAGHPPGIVRRAGTSVWEELQRSGAALGLIDSEVFQLSEPIHFEAGDLLVIYTDGITEAKKSDSDELFGEARLRDTILKNAGRSSAEITQEIVKTVGSFCGGKSADDVTLVTVRRGQ